ncbi:anthranilate phosphoribosyltransferase [Jatrophihabitans sp. GAS493]|uniref:anthranilate phosphoribosyltransferase n=1 Tax=Jatrophihabitans sp. GAS493 TaxID=1907575 RepID=UPI000BB8FF39|nr:anthranilate phosphoribosyltransferase [Jatrophihabitans sp. GAS493]SOD74387.1 anthranilate phosphoribosyltransferase [Jatrophihabitans sp. GAS493]
MTNVPTAFAAFSWPNTLATLLRREELSGANASWAMNEIMGGDATPVQIASFAVLLRAKGETAAELGALASTMRDRAVPVTVSGRSVDLVGTGGDLAQTVNITTMAALVVAGSGRQVTKHGNRSASSACGTADVLEELGVVIDLPAAGVARTVAEAGIGFCFAPVYHAGMRFAGAPRREMGVPTAFNLLGPLTNPARPEAAAIGCADLRMAPVVAQVLADRGDTAMVFRGDDGLDELTTTTTSQVWTAEAGEVRHSVLDPKLLGLATVAPDDLRGGDRIFNASVVREVLGGAPGPVRDAVLLNAAAGIAAFDGLGGAPLLDALAQGLEVARTSIDSGCAATRLAEWVRVSASARDSGDR